MRIGSRGSQLALWQANHVAGLLRGQGHAVEIEIIRTTGDRLQEVTFAEVGTKGMFTLEIEQALEAGRIDLAVHSLKDLPTELPEQFALGAIPARVDPRDVLVSKEFARLADLPARAKIGTSSLRRRAQLRHLRPDLEYVEFRGNVDTRLRKLKERGLDARFIVGDALDLGALGEQYDTVIDSGLFHSFEDDDRSRFVDSLRAAAAAGGRYYLLCFTDQQPGDWGPRRVSQDEIRASFADGWRVESIEAATFEVVHRRGSDGALAWLATITRT